MCVLDGSAVRASEGGHRVHECHERQVRQATALDAGACPLAQPRGSVPVLLVHFDQCELGEAEGLYVRGAHGALACALVQCGTGSAPVAGQVVSRTGHEAREAERVAV